MNVVPGCDVSTGKEEDGCDRAETGSILDCLASRFNRTITLILKQ